MTRLMTESDVLTVLNDDETATFESRNALEMAGDKLDIAKAALQYFEIDPAKHRFTLSLETTIPMRAGMAGSTALLASLVGALTTYLNKKMSPYHLAETTRRIEADVLKVLCGLQDQHIAVFGGLNFMDFFGKEDLMHHSDEPLATVEPLAALVPEPPLLLAHTGIQHHSGTIHTSPRQRWLAGEASVKKAYRRVAELGRLGKRAMIENDWSLLGRLMCENHAIVSELGGSGPANDRLIDAAMEAGAWGAKLAGAGGGGTIIVLTENPIPIGKALMEAGADSLLYPRPQPGLTVAQW